jgi:hypothetical protein
MLAGCASRVPVATSAPVRVSDEVAELCAGVPEAQRERPHFLQRDGIEAVRELTGDERATKFAGTELRGAEIAVRARPDETRHRLARVLRCHMAWHDEMMFTGDFDDPLRVGQPEISFDETERGLVIRIAGHDRQQGEEILRRAQALLEPTSAARD